MTKWLFIAVVLILASCNMAKRYADSRIGKFSDSKISSNEISTSNLYLNKDTTSDISGNEKHEEVETNNLNTTEKIPVHEIQNNQIDSVNCNHEARKKTQLAPVYQKKKWVDRNVVKPQKKLADDDGWLGWVALALWIYITILILVLCILIFLVSWIFCPAMIAFNIALWSLFWSEMALLLFIIFCMIFGAINN